MNTSLYGSVLVLVLGLAVSGCQSTLSREQCETADWQNVGYEDGLKGLPTEVLDSHREACGKHGVVPLRDEYFQGRAKGLDWYCQPGNGFNQGREGVQYSGVCPSRQEPEFLQAYRQGRFLGDHERELEALRDIKRTLETEIKSIDKRRDSRFFAETDRGEKPVSVDLIILAESMEKEKSQLQEDVREVTRQIHNLSLRIDSIIANIRW